MIEITEKSEIMTLENFWSMFEMNKDKLVVFVKKALRYGVVYTHGGKAFHADETFSLALLEIYREKLNDEAGKEVYPPFRVIRKRNIQDCRNVLKIDVDATVFDHHFPRQKAAFRENGVQYATAGLVWAVLGTEFVTEEQAKQIDESVFMPLDANDNGINGYPSQYFDFISNMVPNWNEDVSVEFQMAQAVEYAKMILKRTLAKFEAINLARKEVQKTYENAKDKRIICLPKFMNWEEVLTSTPDAQFVIWKDNNSYNCQAVPPTLGSFEMRTPFCKEWRGLRKKELKDVSGLALEFCHSTGFFLVADTLEDAIKACKISMQ